VIRPTERHVFSYGVQYIYRFDNGYGASLIRHKYSYGGTEGLWEIAVLDRGGKLTHETSITNDVLGNLNEDQVMEVLVAIESLDEAPQ
jgi:hypothetical protein